MRLPRALEAWEAELAIFPPDVALGLGGLVARLALAVGPMRLRAERGRGSPDGYDGLARRGDYATLLMSEWLLADELPDEFLRRVAMNEHAFLARAYEEPAASRRSVVLFDAGPDQAGAPRIAHVAALVMFARRARDARAELAWGVLQARSAPLAEAVTAAGVLGLVEARTREPATADDVDEGVRRAAPRGPHDELWIVGGPRLEVAGLRHKASFVQIDDVLEPAARALRVRVAPPRGAERGAELELPLPELAARLLRDPFQVVAAASARAPVALGLVAGDVLLDGDGHRVYARADDGSLLTHVFGSSPRAPPGPVLRFVPPSGYRVVAAGYSRRERRLLVATQSAEGVLVLHTLSRKGNQAAPKRTYAPLDAPAFDGPLAALYAGRDGRLCMRDARARIVRFLPGKPVEVDDLGVIAIAPGPAGTESVVTHWDDRVELMTTFADTPATTMRVPNAIARVRAFYRAGPPRLSVAVETAESEWTIFPKVGDGMPWRVPPGLEVCGFLARDAAASEPALVVLDAARRSIGLFQPDAYHVIVASEAPLSSVVVAQGHPLVAYTTEGGELVVYSVSRGAAIARLAPGQSEHVTRAAEGP